MNVSKNFSNFTLGDSVYGIGDNVLQEIATAFEYDLKRWGVRLIRSLGLQKYAID